MLKKALSVFMLAVTLSVVGAMGVKEGPPPGGDCGPASCVAQI